MMAYQDDECALFCKHCGPGLCVCACFLAFLTASGLLLGFGIDNLTKYSVYTQTACNITSVSIEKGLVEVGVQFEIQDITMMDSIMLGCTNWNPNCVASSSCGVQGEYCKDIAPRYQVGQQIICYWYQNANEVSIYGNLNGLGIAMTVIGAILLCCICGGGGVKTASDSKI